jgi:hypothetical protein
MPKTSGGLDSHKTLTLGIAAGALIVDNRIKHIAICAAAAGYREGQPSEGKGQKEVRDKAHIALHLT